MIVAGILGHFWTAGYYFWALGPQLVLCMGFAYFTCRRRGGRMLDWLIGGFAAALLPIVGVVLMAVLWWRARDRPAGRSGASA